MHGGVKFYRGSASAARTYVEADRSRVDDYYLAEGTGVATRYVATVLPAAGGRGMSAAQDGGTLDGDAYERWVAGYDVETGEPRGRLRSDAHGLRFVEIVVNGPKTWSLAATLHPEIAAAYDAAQDRAALEIIGWLAGHATTRVGPRGRQVQVPVEQLEAAVVRHHTSRAGDPHRHLHLQVNARVFAAGRWRGLHSVGVVDSIEALNGIGHAAVACDPEFRNALAAHGYSLDPESGEVTQLARYAGAFSARAAQITRNIDRYEATWRTEHPGEEPGPRLRRGWDRRAWAQARPDKVVPTDGAQMAQRWREELLELGFTPPFPPGRVDRLGTAIGRINREAVTDLVLSRLGARRSSWNGADIRGEVERIVAAVDVVTPAPVRRELVEDLTSRTVAACEPLLDRHDVPDHVRVLTSRDVLEVEADLVSRISARANHPARPSRVGTVVAGRELDHAQQLAVAALAGTGKLLVIEGAAGAGKTTTLAVARELLDMNEQRLVVATPTSKAARVAQDQVGADAFSAAWLVHQHGYRWDDDGHWARTPVPREYLDARARLLPGDVLLVDEAGMLDQDTARALLTIADETGARVALVGDRHQLPAVGRGGVLDHAARWTPPEACLALETVHRFADPGYADLTLRMRTGKRSGEVFDALVDRGQVVVHPTEVERLATLTTGDAGDGLIVADTCEQVAALNAAIRDHRIATDPRTPTTALTTGAGERVGVGDRIATRRNDRDLGVANRDTWTVTAVSDPGALTVIGRNGDRVLPAGYVREHVELAYATTIHGAQGETVDHAHLLLGETTGAAAAYVAMTRGRLRNTAHLVAENLQDAREQWIQTFSRDRADLGPDHAARAAAEDIDRYGPQPRTQPRTRPPAAPPPRSHPRPPEPPVYTSPHRGSPRIGF
jgi:exodeoxyribonuclease V alpha subunit